MMIPLFFFFFFRLFFSPAGGYGGHQRERGRQEDAIAKRLRSVEIGSLSAKNEETRKHYINGSISTAGCTVPLTLSRFNVPNERRRGFWILLHPKRKKQEISNNTWHKKRKYAYNNDVHRMTYCCHSGGGVYLHQNILNRIHRVDIHSFLYFQMRQMATNSSWIGEFFIWHLVQSI